MPGNQAGVAGDPAALAQAVRPGETRLVWIETPCNPTWEVIDIRAAAALAHDAGALLAVDKKKAAGARSLSSGLPMRVRT